MLKGQNVMLKDMVMEVMANTAKRLLKKLPTMCLYLPQLISLSRLVLFYLRKDMFNFYHQKPKLYNQLPSWAFLDGRLLALEKICKQSYCELMQSCLLFTNLNFDTPQRKFSMAPIIDRQLSRQKIRQKISVIITNTCVFAQFSLVFAVFKTKHELKCQNELFF